MEHHNMHHRKVKEKNLYLLHLDKARILLIVFVIAGVIIASFLLGMNMMKESGGSNEVIAENDFNLNRQSDSQLYTSNLPPIPDADKGIAKENEKNKDNGIGEANPLAVPQNGKTPDIISSDNIELVQPKKTEKRKVEKRNVSNNKKQERKVAKRQNNKTRKNKRSQKRRNKRANVAAVSFNTAPRKARKDPAFAIQIASYDNNGKAQSEVRRLKRLQFDAFVDRKRVNGKRYYRVRVGPISSRRRALNLLNNIQDIDRYEESYLVKE